VTFTQYQERVFFFIGLAGVIGTGAIAGVGGANYWALANGGTFSGHQSVRGTLLMYLAVVMVAGCDVVAGSVIFAGAVLVVQRLRGRI
jgi:hypothetical protein